jgi:hypothetical protein
MDFEQPIGGGFEAVAEAPAEESLRRFEDTIARGRPARVAMQATLSCEQIRVAAFTGEFVALPADAR